MGTLKANADSKSNEATQAAQQADQLRLAAEKAMEEAQSSAADY